MSDEYLWEKSGSDPEVERLERALRPLGLGPDARAPALPRRRRARLLWIPLAAAAAVAALLLLRERPPGAGVVVDSGDRTFTVAEGAWVDETESERVLRLGDAGDVRVEAGARVRVVRIREDENRLWLERGTVHARIAASVRPRFFQVETPSATCVDLGCAYTLSVDAEGRSVVRVDFGRVAFEVGAREVYVPADAECVAEKGRGVGTPVFRDAPREFAAAAAAFDAVRGDGRRGAAAALAGKAGRARDTLTLWHLLQDPDREVRASALGALRRFEEAPASAPGDAALSGERGAVDAWRAALEKHW